MAETAGIIAINSKFTDLAEANPNGSGNRHLVQQLADAGYWAVYVAKGDYSLDDESEPTVTAHIVGPAPDGDGLAIAQEGVTLGLGVEPHRVQAVRTRVNAPKELDEIVPVVNGRALRELGGDKWRQYQILHDHMPPSMLLGEDDSDNLAKLAVIPTRQVVVKGVRSQDGQWLKIVDREEALEVALAMQVEMAGKRSGNNGVILQAYQPGVAFDTLQGFSETEAAILREVQPDTQTELRMYCFVSRSRLGPVMEAHAVYRLNAGQRNERFVAIDQASMPAAAFNMAAASIEAIMQVVDFAGGLIAIDLFRSSDGTLGIREINTQDPVLAEMLSPNEAFQWDQILRLSRLMIRLATGDRN